VQPQPGALADGVVVLDLNGDHGADAREEVDKDLGNLDTFTKRHQPAMHSRPAAAIRPLHMGDLTRRP